MKRAGVWVAIWLLAFSVAAGVQQLWAMASDATSGLDRAPVFTVETVADNLMLNAKAKLRACGPTIKPQMTVDRVHADVTFDIRRLRRWFYADNVRVTATDAPLDSSAVQCIETALAHTILTHKEVLEEGSASGRVCMSNRDTTKTGEAQ